MNPKLLSDADLTEICFRMHVIFDDVDYAEGRWIPLEIFEPIDTLRSAVRHRPNETKLADWTELISDFGSHYDLNAVKEIQVSRESFEANSKLFNRPEAVKGFRFQPVRVEGLDDVEEVTVFPDSIVFMCGSHVRRFHFSEMKDRKSRQKAGQAGGYIGEHDSGAGYFRWLTDPEIIVFPPPKKSGNPELCAFRRIHETLYRGQFATYDLG
ncbi:MAG: hypothetical protein AAF585_06765 [Verrucomicrobiota bacterium]